MGCPYEGLVESVTFRLNKEINKHSERFFKLLGLRHFWYFELKDSGEFFHFGSYQEWEEYLLQEKFYLDYEYLRDPSHQKNHIRVYRTEEDLYPFLVAGREKWGLQNSLQFLTRKTDRITVFGVTVDTPKSSHLNLLLNEIPLIKLFFKKFREENHSFFRSVESSQINLKDVLGDLFYKNSKKQSYLLEKECFMKELGLEATAQFTLREKEMLGLVAKGYFASEMGTILHLSKRTIEHHLERLKIKLECKRKSDLLKKARDLEQFYSF